MHISNEETWNTVGSLIKQEYSPSSTFVNNELGGIQVALVLTIYPIIYLNVFFCSILLIRTL